MMIRLCDLLIKAKMTITTTIITMTTTKTTTTMTTIEILTKIIIINLRTTRVGLNFS